MQEIVPVSLENELQSSYIDYAMSVIISRAIPDARDGLKPVQRRVLYSMYNLKNFHDQPTKKSARIVGECFVRDSMVLTKKGLVPIQNIKKGDIIYTQNSTQKVSEIYIMPKRKLIKVKINNGLENIVTSSQQFKVLTNKWKFVWKDAKDLQPGDYIVTRAFYPEISKEVNINGINLNKNIAYLLGQLLSDGFVIHDNDRGKYHRIGFCSADINVINSITNCLTTEFNYIPHIEEKLFEYSNINGQMMVSKIYQIRVNNGEVSQFFINNFDLMGRVAWNKRVPDEIFKSPQDVINEFLSGLIDGDGHIHASKTRIQYATTSKELANQVMVLLHHIGVHGKKYAIEKEGGGHILGRKIVKFHTAYSLEFDGINACRLAAKLNLREKKKKERATELINNEVFQSDFDILPFGSQKIFAELSKHHLGSGWYQDGNGQKFRAGIHYKDGTKIRYSSDLYDMPIHTSQVIAWGIQNKLAKLNSTLSPFINSIINDKINFSEVTSIEDAGEDVTYDIQVENQHEFIANGMVSHNCMGKFHPHGDTAIYDSLARLAQTFSVNHTLAEGQGNFGSIDGDPPAAMRYTEVKLTKLAEEMLEDIEKETVEFVPNFDDTETEPTVLPSKVPNLLINGATGIAVGVATSIPPHNLAEVCDAVVKRIENKDSTAEDILTIIKGPDFPTGGIALMSQNAYNGYKYGRGQLSIRAKADIDDKNRKIVINEIPYNVNKSNLMRTMAELAREKTITGLRDIRDESDKKGIRIVIDFKEEANGSQILNMLYKHTQLQVTFPLINLAIIGKSLKSLNIVQFIDTFLTHRREVVLKRSKYELNVAESRLHIVEGLLIAIASIDEVIKAIKASAEISSARTNLISKFKLTEKQANAILDMKLSRLTHLENNSLTEEAKELEGKVKYYNGVIANPDQIDGLIKQETLDIKKKFGRPRRTEIQYSEEETEITNEDTISNEKVTVILTNGGYVKRLALTNYKEQGRGGKGIISINLKEGDYVKQILTCNNKDFIIGITNTGRAYWIKAYNVPEGGRYSEGKAIVNLVDTKQEKIIDILNINEFTNSKLAFLTAKGVVKKIKASLFSKPRANGVRAINLNEGDQIADVIMYSSEKNLIIATKQGKSIMFEETDLRYIGRTAMGVRGIRLSANDVAVNIIAANDAGSMLTVTENGYGKITDLNKYRLQGRGGSGVINLKVNEKTGPVQRCLFIKGEDKVVLINSLGVSITFPTSEIRVTGRAASGVRLMHLSPGQKVVDAMLLGSEAATVQP